MKILKNEKAFGFKVESFLFMIFAYRDIGNFVHFWQFFGRSIFIVSNFKLKIIKNM